MTEQNMTEQNITEQIMIEQKISIKDLDFDNLDNNELNMIRDEIDVVIKINDLKIERMQYIKKQISDEKIQLRNEMQQELKKEKEKLLKKMKDEYDDDEDDEDSCPIAETTIYDKKTPKGRTVKNKPTKTRSRVTKRK